jgi:PAS domain S-box-containing protein
MRKLPIVGRVFSLGRKDPPQRAVPAPPPPRDDRMRSAFERAPIGLAIATADGRWLQSNERFRDIVGYSREELSRITFNSMTHPDDAQREANHVRKLMAGEEDSYRIAKRTIDKRGTYRTLDVQVSIARASGGDPDCFVYVVDSAAEMKAAHTSAALLDEVDDVAIIRTDARGFIVGWNRGAQRMFGYERDEVIGRHRRVLYRDADTWDGNPTRQMTMAASGRIEVDDWRVTKDGRHLWMHSAMSPFMPDGAEVRGYIEIVTPPPAGGTIDASKVIEDLRAEVDKRRRTEESLREALTDLRTTAEETMNELKIMTHALRNEMDRRKAVEHELRAAHDRLTAMPEPSVALEQIVVADELPLQDWTGTFTPVRVLQDVAGERRNGTLLFASGDREKQFFLENGRVFSCASNDPSMFLTERLLAAQTIDEEARRRALEIQVETRLAIGRILLILGALSEEQLVTAMRDKVAAEIDELATWSDARWMFVEQQTPSLKLVPLRLTMDELLAPKPAYFASPNAKKVHTDICIGIRRVPAENRVPFLSIADAEANGMEACRICIR